MSKSCGGDKLNLEYLKNVVLRYMLSSDAGDREHMLKAIGAVLVFTKSEAARVSAFNASWWRMKKWTNLTLLLSNAVIDTKLVVGNWCLF